MISHRGRRRTSLGDGRRAVAHGEWEELAAAQPDGRGRMPCGYDAARSAEEAEAVREPARARWARQRIVAVDASAYFSRPGPRLVDRRRAARRICSTPTACRRRSAGSCVELTTVSAGGGT